MQKITPILMELFLVIIELRSFVFNLAFRVSRRSWERALNGIINHGTRAIYSIHWFAQHIMLATRHSWRVVFMIDLFSQKEQGCCDRFSQMGVVFTETVRYLSGLFY